MTKQQQKTVDPGAMASRVLSASVQTEVEQVLEENNIAGRGICNHATLDEVKSLLDSLPADKRPDMT